MPRSTATAAAVPASNQGITPSIGPDECVVSRKYLSRTLLGVLKDLFQLHDRILLQAQGLVNVAPPSTPSSSSSPTTFSSLQARTATSAHQAQSSLLLQKHHIKHLQPRINSVNCQAGFAENASVYCTNTSQCQRCTAFREGMNYARRMASASPFLGSPKKALQNETASITLTLVASVMEDMWRGRRINSRALQVLQTCRPLFLPDLEEFHEMVKLVRELLTKSKFARLDFTVCSSADDDSDHTVMTGECDDDEEGRERFDLREIERDVKEIRKRRASLEGAGDDDTHTETSSTPLSSKKAGKLRVAAQTPGPRKPPTRHVRSHNGSNSAAPLTPIGTSRSGAVNKRKRYVTMPTIHMDEGDVIGRIV